MTWYYEIADDGSTITVYEDDSEFSGKIKEIQNDGSGFTIPTDIKEVMKNTWENEANLGNSPVMSVRAGCILMDLVTEDIQEGTPPS